MADKKQRLETSLVFNAQDAIKNITSIKEALDSVNKITFNNLRSAMESIQGVMKVTSAQSEKSAKTVEKQVEKEKNLLQQRAALHQKMVDAYSKNPKVDLSGAIKEYDRLNQKITDMYTSMGKPKQALNALKDAMLMTANTPWADKVVKQYERLALMIDTVNKKQKAILENANGTTAGKSTSGANKAYDAMIAQGNKKAEQMRRMWEQLDKEQARQQQKVDAQTQKEIASYERQQKAIEAGQDAILKSIIRHNRKVEAERERALREEQKVRLALSGIQSKQQQAAGKEQTKYFNQVMGLVSKIEALQNRINSHKGMDGLVYSKSAFNADMARFDALKRKAEEFGALNIASMMNKSIFDDVNIKTPVPRQQKNLSFSDSQSKHMQELRSEAERFYHIWKQTKDTTALMNFKVKASEIQQMNKEARELNDKLGRINRSLFNMDNLLDKIKMRAGWITTGLVENAILNTPDEILRQVSELELAMAGVAQVMPKLETEDAQGKAAINQKAMNEEFAEFAKIASDYGQAARDVVEAGRSIGRMYGDGDGDKDRGVKNTNLLTMQAARMATVDNFDMMEATRGLESALAQFNMQTSNTAELMARTNRILDVWTKLAHNGGASAQDLVDGVRQAGAAAHEAGVSFEFLNALIATGVRNTAKSGNEIGTTLKSMFSSILSDKNIKNMEKFGISIYKTAEDGTQKLRSMEDIILEISLAMKSSGANAKELRDFMMVVSGGKQQFSKVEAILGNYKELLRTIKEANSSQGFSQRQLEIQMDTIARKLQSIKGIWTDLLMSNASKGLTNDIKWFLNVIHRISVGFKNLDSDWYSFTKRCFEAALAVGGLNKLLLVFSRMQGRYQAGLRGYTNNSVSILGGFNSQRREAERKAAYQAQVNKSSASSVATAGNTSATSANTTATEANSAGKAANTTVNTANTASLTANTRGLIANTAGLTSNTSSLTGNVGGLTANSNASKSNSVTTTANTQVKNINTSANIRNTESLLVNAGASSKSASASASASGVILAGANAKNISSQAIKNNTVTMGQNTSVVMTGITAQSKLGQSAVATGNAIRNLNVPMAAATNTMRGVAVAGAETVGKMGLLRGAMAALGGPVGTLLTVLTLLQMAYSAVAYAMGEADEAHQKLLDDLEESISKQKEEMDVWQQKSETCQGLADVYNDLADKVESESLTEEQAIQVKEQMGEIEQTVSEIMKISSDKLVENGRINIKTIVNEAQAHKKKSHDELVEKKREVEADKAATVAAITDSNARIEQMRGEVDAIGKLGDAWQWLKDVIADVAESRMNALKKSMDDYKSSGLSDTTMTWMYGGSFDVAESQIASLQETVDANRSPHRKLEIEIENNNALEERLADLDTELEQLNMAIAEADLEMTNGERYLEDADNGYGKPEGSGGHGGSGGSGGSGKEPKEPEDDSEKLQNKYDKAEIKRIKNELDGKLKYIDDALKGLDQMAEIYGMTDTIKKSKQHWYDARKKLIGQYKGQFKDVYDSIMAKSNDLWDEDMIESAGSELANKVIQAANDYMGTPYVWGGSSSSGIDCSGLIQNIYDAAGVAIERTADAQAEDFAAKGAYHSVGDGYSPKAGDSVFMHFGSSDYGVVNGDTISHVGVADGNGNVIHASSGSGEVVIVPIEHLSNGIVGYGDFSSYAGQIGSGVKVPNPIPESISKEQWDALDIQGKKEYAQAHKEDNDAWKAVLGRLDNILDSSKEVSDLFKEEAETARNQQKARIDDALKSIETANKQASFDETNELFDLGINASEVDKAEISLRRLNKEIKAISDNIGELPEGSVKKKELEQELKSKKLEAESKSFDLNYERRSRPINYQLDMLDAKRHTEESKRFGISESDKDKFLAQQKALLQQQLQALEEQYESLRMKQQEQLRVQLETIEADERKIAMDKEKVATGEMTEEELEREIQALRRAKAEWNNYAESGSESMQKVALEAEAVKAKINEVDSEMDRLNTQVSTTIQDGVYNMFEGVLLEGKSFQDGWQALWKDIARIALQQLIKVWLFQKVLGIGAGNGGGLLGGLFGGLFGGGSSGGSVGDIAMATGGAIPKYAGGGGFTNGLIRGAGTGTSDDILTYLQHRGQFIMTSNGEYIIQKKAVDALGVNFLNILNKHPEAVKSMNRYASGGSIGYTMSAAMNPHTMNTYRNYTKKSVGNSLKQRGNTSKLEELMSEQNGLIQGLGKKDSNGSIVVLNTHASSDDVLKAIQKNPRGIQKLLGQQRQHGFR